MISQNPGYTKLLVGLGFTESIINVDIEIIDLESSASNCSNLENFTEPTFAPFGGLEFNDNPFICGGYSNDCFHWQDSALQVFEPLNEMRSFAASCSSPFHKESHKLIVAGGTDGSGYKKFFLVFK